MLAWLGRMVTWWQGETLGTQWLTWRKGRLVGADQFGNRYFEEKGGSRRWVLYEGEIEASKVPPRWNAWLHHTTNEPPTGEAPAPREWEREHVPNPTGTPAAYRPPGHISLGGPRAPTGGDYEPWRP